MSNESKPTVEEVLTRLTSFQAKTSDKWWLQESIRHYLEHGTISGSFRDAILKAMDEYATLRNQELQDEIKDLQAENEMYKYANRSVTEDRDVPEPPKPQSMCHCKNVEMGSYSNQSVLTTPQGKIAGIDNCLVDEIKSLWDLGIQTIESCCGHNKVSGYIAVSDDSIPQMIKLGYLQQDINRPDIFYPKTRF